MKAPLSRGIAALVQQQRTGPQSRFSQVYNRHFTQTMQARAKMTKGANEKG